VTQAPEDRPAAVRPPPSRSPAELGALTDLCVKCGLCLPHCPTYALSRQEGDSPRGRIALVQGLASGRLAADDRLAEHLGGCLTCRSCESVCPAKVPYGEIIDRGKALLRDSGRPPAAGVESVIRLATSPRLARLAPGLLALARGVGLPALFGRLLPDHWLTRSLDLRPRGAVPPAPGSVHEPEGAVRGEVALFLGCIAPHTDARTLTDLVAAATALGYRVRVPAGQGCCGALDLHDGRPEAADETNRRNLAAFGGDEPVLCAATGCAVTLAEACAPHGGELAFGDRIRDAAGFLLESLDDRELSGPPRPLRIAVHTSCTARLRPGGGSEVASLLARIPGIETEPLTAGRCCGAAGHHFLTRGAQADALRQPLLDEIAGIGPDYVVSANPGCALHLGAGLGAAPEVLHPVSLLIRALRNDW
jgi:glycolate oxidase iron-sulfur subunit